MEDEDIDTLEGAIEGVKGDMQKDLDSAKKIEGGGPEYKYTTEDVINDLDAEGSLGTDDSTFESGRDVAPKDKNK